MPEYSHLRRIGLIADSHGSIPALERCVDVLRKKGADLLVHLGDFLDSLHFCNAFEIVNFMELNHIIAVKGNNDYQVEKMFENDYSENTTIRARKQVLKYLKQVPVVRQIGTMGFSHSMPYETMRAIYDPIDDGSTGKATEIFADTGYSILFCGHSHRPVLFRKAGAVRREPLLPGRPTGISREQRYIFIIGSAENGKCGLYDIEHSQYELLMIS